MLPEHTFSQSTCSKYMPRKLDSQNKGFNGRFQILGASNIVHQTRLWRRHIICRSLSKNVCFKQERPDEPKTFAKYLNMDLKESRICICEITFYLGCLWNWQGQILRLWHLRITLYYWIHCCSANQFRVPGLHGAHSSYIQGLSPDRKLVYPP